MNNNPAKESRKVSLRRAWWGGLGINLESFLSSEAPPHASVNGGIVNQSDRA